MEKECYEEEIQPYRETDYKLIIYSKAVDHVLIFGVIFVMWGRHRWILINNKLFPFMIYLHRID